MINIFMITTRDKMPYFEAYLANAMFRTVINGIKLMITCLIHGMVYGEN
jgi:hypothetical protein